MLAVDVVEVDDEFNPVSHIRAERAEWNEHLSAWELFGGTRVTGLRPSERRSEPKPLEVYRGGVTPEEIALYRSGDFVELLSTERINQLLRRPQSYGTVDLLRVKHTRFTQPLLNVVMLLLAIPCVLTRQPLNFKIAGTKLLVLVGLCMAAIFLSHQIAGNPPGPQWFDRWPAMMAWMPLLIFAPVAVFLMDRIQS
jgi:lipopolysaccharide export LptBFGC system permease protein LptF